MEAIFGMLIPVTWIVMLVVERLFPGKKALPKVRFWLLKGTLFFLFAGFLNTILPLVFTQMLGGRTLFHLQWTGMFGGALIGMLASDFVQYWLHRLMHRVPALWRWTHQMHHSAERMDLAGMSYMHPFDAVLSFGLTILVTVLLGLSPEAAAVAGFMSFVTAVFQHSNIRTPAWLGYVFMRPEQHGLHHARDVHAYNYANYPIWDILFRTFRNPAYAEFPAFYGFWDGASARLGAMLRGRDVGRVS
jgi:sterol desaturase/sphingolipid hydroxylase (fatty acid hydroxylase superfamily)